MVEAISFEMTTSTNIPLSLKGDNQESIVLIHNLVFYVRTKHIDIQHHYIRDKFTAGKINLQYISMSEIIADGMIKPLTHAKFYLFIKQLHITWRSKGYKSKKYRWVDWSQKIPKNKAQIGDKSRRASQKTNQSQEIVKSKARNQTIWENLKIQQKQKALSRNSFGRNGSWTLST